MLKECQSNLTEIPNPLWNRRDEDYYIHVDDEVRTMDFLDYINDVIADKTFDADYQRSFELLKEAHLENTLTICAPPDQRNQDESDIIPLDLPTIVFGDEARMEETFYEENDNESETSEDEEDQELPPEAKCRDHLFHIAMSTFWIVFNIPIAAYTGFNQAFSLLQSNAPSFPKALVTLHRWVDKFLPPTVMRETTIKVATRGLPAGGPKALNPDEKLVYCDPLEMTKALIQNPRRRANMYFGAQILVEDTMELWESTAWGSSIRTVSGEFTTYPPLPTAEDTPSIHAQFPKEDEISHNTDESSEKQQPHQNRPSVTDGLDPMFPGDVVEYILPIEQDPFQQPRLGQIRNLCKDQKFKKNNKFCAFINPILDLVGIERHLTEKFGVASRIIDDVRKASAAINNKYKTSPFYSIENLFMLEDAPDFVHTINIRRRLSHNFLDPRFKTKPTVSCFCSKNHADK